MGGGNPADRHPNSAMVRSIELLHQPDFIRVLQQEIPAWIHGHRQKQALLRKAALLRNRRHDVLIHEHEEILAFLQQQLLDEKTGAGTRQRCLLHLQQHRRLNPGNGLPRNVAWLLIFWVTPPKIGQKIIFALIEIQSHSIHTDRKSVV